MLLFIEWKLTNLCKTSCQLRRSRSGACLAQCSSTAAHSRCQRCRSASRTGRSRRNRSGGHRYHHQVREGNDKAVYRGFQFIADFRNRDETKQYWYCDKFRESNGSAGPSTLKRWNRQVFSKESTIMGFRCLSNERLFGSKLFQCDFSCAVCYKLNKPLDYASRLLINEMIGEFKEVPAFAAH
uniref:Uncharacterized protein n=1 Tax=Ditylenchus dipsaci TaxID=166011 RepID=A0A915EKP4_9BILA